MPSRKITEKDLIAALARVNEQDNPNPNREGCPTPSILEDLATAPAGARRVEESILLHLGSCSPCSKDLKTLRENAKRRKT